MQAQGAPGADDVGDGVGDTELYRNLDRPVESDHGRVDSSGGEVLSHQIRIGGGDPPAGQIGHRPAAVRRCGVAEARRPEPQRQPLADRGAGFGGQIPAGDPEVEVPRPDIDGDVLGAQEEELDAVDPVDDGEVLWIAAPPVSGFGQDLGRRLGQRTFIGYRDTQHDGPYSFR